MLFILKVVLIAASCYLAELVFPWWSIVICAFIIGGVIPTRSFNAFLSGFLGVGLLWLIYAWVIDSAADSIISSKIAPLFFVNNESILIVLTALTGAIAGGMGAWSGSLFINIFRKEKPGRYR